MTSFSWNLRVCAAGKDRATVYLRRHQFGVGASVQFDEEYDGITALEYVLGAIGADIVNGLRSLGRRRRVEIENVEALVSGELNNPLVHLGVVGEEGNPGMERVAIKVYVGSVESEEDVRRVWEEMLEKSPLVQTFKKALDLVLEMEVVI